MTEILNIHDAEAHLSRLVDRVASGEEIVIARAGKPIARLVAVDDGVAGPRRPGLLRGMTAPDAAFAPLSEDELAAWARPGTAAISVPCVASTLAPQQKGRVARQRR